MLRTICVLSCVLVARSTTAREINVEVDGRPYFVAAGDFNRDGRTDFAVSGATFFGDAIPYDAYFLSLYEADGAGGFLLRAKINTGRSLTTSLSVADINDNGFEDLVTSEEVFLDPGLVGFVSRWPLPQIGYRAATGDFNGDGRDDIAVANEQQRSVSFITYDNGLKLATSVSVPHFPNSLIAIDVDGNGLSDVVTGASKGTVSILYAAPDFQFREVHSAPLGGKFLEDVAATDLDGDSLLDLIALDQYGSAFVLLNRPDAIVPIHELPTMERSLCVIAADVTGDGASDVVVGRSDGILLVFEFDDRGNVKGSFAIRPVGYAYEITAADMNGDGVTDLVVPDVASSHVTMLYGPLSPTPPRRRSVRP